ncbi:MAG: hypothetical protein ACHQ52_09245 [Candidatus Eisenbacteria bacterium]
MHLRPGITAAAVAFVFAAATHPAWAEAYDTPSLVVVDSSRTSITLTVSAGPSGTPAGFGIQYVKASDLDYAGSWDNAVALGLVTTAEFTGTPTFNVSETAPNFRLSPYADHDAEVGDLYDETGVAASDFTFELDAETDYDFRVYARGDNGGEQSLFSSHCHGKTHHHPNDCTFTQGYWKNHSSQWPVSNLKLGTVSYSKQQLLAIFNTPAQGNGLLILAHQLIAAKLNIAQGADPSPVSAIIADADALIGSKVCPPIGGGFLQPSAVDNDAQALDDYNNGKTSVPHCGSTPTVHATWGAVKAIYR